MHLTPAHPYQAPRGRVLGGSTTVNGGYFIRARRCDFTRWARQAGDARWTYERVLPFLRSLETDLDHGAGPEHGDAGPVPVRRTPVGHPAARGTRRRLPAPYVSRPVSPVSSPMPPRPRPRARPPSRIRNTPRTGARSRPSPPW
ncbi:GMC family oxidoreductase N-terminal domain-containing protein [Streptomyces sp. NPDC000941]